MHESTDLSGKGCLQYSCYLARYKTDRDNYDISDVTLACEQGKAWHMSKLTTRF